jgi:hypothetical protein
VFVSEYQVKYMTNGDPRLQPASSERLALEYAIAIIKDDTPQDISIIRDGGLVFSRDQIFDHPLAAGIISKSSPGIPGSWGRKINLP